ncbi:MAG: 30S ribosomal protein S19 [Candidatus Babeliales bacterium]
MSRSAKKGAYVERSLYENFLKQKGAEKAKPIKTWSRRSQLIPEFVGYVFEVHNGKTFQEVRVMESMVGYRFGDFVLTRKKGLHSGQRKSGAK